MVAKTKASQLPRAPGVYLFLNSRGTIIYVGKAVNLRSRVSSYFQKGLRLGKKTRRMLSETSRLDYIRVESEIEALVLEAKLIKLYRPYYNVQWKDDKDYLYIKISNYKPVKKREALPDSLPTVTTTRRRDDSRALYFGPFPQGHTVKKVLKYLRKTFGYCNWSESKLKQLQRCQEPGRGCFYYHLGLCPGPCAGAISQQDYLKHIDQIAAFLQGKKKKVILNLKKEMRAAARKRNFEEAVRLRDRLRRLEYVAQEFRAAEEYIENPNLIEDQREEEVRSLLGVLSAGLFFPPAADFRIEAYDVSNLQGKNPTASRVVFINGEPDKSLYRRYKIKSPETPNDYLMMKEVLTRRFQKTPKSSLPDLVLIDGGKGQVGAALQVLRELKINAPVVGLAKRQEEIIVPIPTVPPESGAVKFKTIQLPQDAPALKLLRRVRDEAHRFALAYHRYLRRKRIRGIKDTVPNAKLKI